MASGSIDSGACRAEMPPWSGYPRSDCAHVPMTVTPVTASDHFAWAGEPPAGEPPARPGRSGGPGHAGGRLPGEGARGGLYGPTPDSRVCEAISCCRAAGPRRCRPSPALQREQVAGQIHPGLNGVDHGGSSRRGGGAGRGRRRGCGPLGHRARRGDGFGCPALLSLRTGDALRTGRARGTGRTDRAHQALLTAETLLARHTLQTVRTSRALLATLAGRALLAPRALITRRADLAPRALLTGRALQAHRTCLLYTSPSPRDRS